MHVVPALLLLVLTGACSESGARALPNAKPSSSALGHAVLDALARRDVGALRALALGEREFREHVWPELPAARPERNLPLSYVWGDLQQKSEQSLQRILMASGGRPYELLELRFDGEVTPYQTYRVHQNAVFIVRERGGVPTELRLCGSMLEKYGAWKVFSFVVED